MTNGVYKNGSAALAIVLEAVFPSLKSAISINTPLLNKV
jgi:hypothetical protein